MTIAIAVSLIAILVLIVASAIINGSETAITAASRQLHALDEAGNARAKLVNKLVSAPEKLIGAALIGNTLVTVLAAAIASNLAVPIFRPVWPTRRRS